MKYVLLDQSTGIGSMLYLQKAVSLFHDKGYKIIWPVIPEYLYLGEYIKEYNIEFYDVNSEFPFKHLYKKQTADVRIHKDETDTILYLPFGNSHGHFGWDWRHAMRTKYQLIGNSGTNWQSYLKFTRNPQRETDLRKEFGLEEDEPFVFVNTFFRGLFQVKETNFEVNTNLRVIKNDTKPRHIFDYCWLLENAKEIHTVETSLCYLIDVLNTTKNLIMYPRKFDGVNQHKDYEYISGIFKKSWVLNY